MPRYPPPRWLDYDPIGSPLSETPLLPVKLPIPKELAGGIPRDQWFTIDDLFDYCSIRGRPLSGVVDLAFTRYYDPQLFTGRGVPYNKIFVEGHVVPKEDNVKRFIEIVEDLIRKSPNGLIAVHCTHGVNRTGYFICRYLVDVLGWPPGEALKGFSEARGYAIERQNYISDLLPRRQQQNGNRTL